VDEIEKLQHDLQSSVQDQDSILQEAKQKVADLETTLHVIRSKNAYLFYLFCPIDQ
jgi:hypothetical protein